jgi:hypothetical protein
MNTEQFDILMDRLDRIEALLLGGAKPTKEPAEPRDTIDVMGWEPGKSVFTWVRDRFPGATDRHISDALADFRAFWSIRGDKRTQRGWDAAFVRNPVVKTAMTKATLATSSSRATGEHDSVVARARDLYAAIAKGQGKPLAEISDDGGAMAYLINKGLIVKSGGTYRIADR